MAGVDFPGMAPCSTASSTLPSSYHPEIKAQWGPPLPALPHWLLVPSRINSRFIGKAGQLSVLNHLSNLIFHRKGSIRPWALPSAGCVTWGSQTLIFKAGVLVIFRDCGEDSRDYSRGIHKTVLGTQRAFDECFLSLLIFHLTTQTQQLFSHIRWPLSPLSPLQLHYSSKFLSSL